MSPTEGIQVTFLDQTGAKSVKAKIAPTVPVKKIIPTIITKMSLPVTAPDGTPMSYSLDHKEGGKRLLEEQTLVESSVREGDHLIVYPEIVAGSQDQRIYVTDSEIAGAFQEVTQAVTRRLQQHGSKSFIGPHEISGTMLEEWDEFKEEVHLNNGPGTRAELMDIAVTALFGIASLDANARAKKDAAAVPKPVLQPPVAPPPPVPAPAVAPPPPAPPQA